MDKASVLHPLIICTIIPAQQNFFLR